MAHARALSDRFAYPVGSIAARAIRTHRTTYGELLRRVAADLEAGTATDVHHRHLAIDWAIPPVVPDWISRAAREALACSLSSLQVRTVGSPGETAWLGIVAASGAAIAPYRQVAALFGVDVRCPYLDPEVVSAALAADVDDRPIASDGKPLLDDIHRRGSVPRRERVRPKAQTSYGRDFYVGLRRNLGHVVGLLRTSRLAEIGLIDRDRLLRSVHLAAAGASVPPAAIARTIAAEVWMQRGDFT